MKLLSKTPVFLFALVFVLLGSAALWPQADSKPKAGDSNPANAAPASADRVRISANIAQSHLTHKIVPAYPSYAKANRIQGQVDLRVIIDKQGRVIDLKTVSGHPDLVPTATDAVKQWRYSPFLLNGSPVEVETLVVVNFNLTRQ